jgi:cell filamentation protein
VKKEGRYSTSDLVEDQYMPGSNGKVLKNLLGIATQEEIVSALAIVHTELILIHPFREGNGRLSRLLGTLMALQADLPPLDFSDFAEARQEEYFTAVRHGLDRNYVPMEKVFADIISRSLRIQPA